jgi:hypothetical protein
MSGFDIAMHTGTLCPTKRRSCRIRYALGRQLRWKKVANRQRCETAASPQGHVDRFVPAVGCRAYLMRVENVSELSAPFAWIAKFAAKNGWKNVPAASPW